AHLRNRRGGGGGHDGSEIARGHAIDQVAPTIATVGLDQREVGGNWKFEDIIAPVDRASFLAFRQQRAVPRWREDRSQAGARGLDASCEIALRHELELD